MEREKKMETNCLTGFPDYDGNFFCPDGWKDNSWGYDTQPHIEKRNKDNNVVVKVWQDYVDTQKREYSYTKRYLFQICIDEDNVIFYYETDDLDKIKELMKGVNI